MSSRNSYFSTLNPSCKTRYLQKISSIDNVDPFELPNKEWKQDISDFPAITYADVVTYLVLKTSYYTLEEFKAYKSLEAHNQFVSGWIKDLKTKKVDGKDMTIISARVMHSQRVRDTPLNLWIIANDSGTVESAHCYCMAGLSETCTHIGAVLFAIECYVRHRESKTVTQEKAYWLVPPTKKITYAPVTDIDFTSASTKRKNLNQFIDTGKNTEKSLRCNTNVEPSVNEIEAFYSALSKTSGQPAILSIVDGYSDSYVPKSLEKEKYPMVLTELYKPECVGADFETLREASSKIKIACTHEQAQNVERATRQQSKSKAWYHFRSGRVTASKLKDVCHTSTDKPSTSLIATICYPEVTKFVSAATKWGSNNENKAKQAYNNHMKERHNQFNIKDSGLIIHPDYPHLGASPDGVVKCECCVGFGCLEIKCPYNARGKSLEEAAGDKKFCCSIIKGCLQLKRSHGYYYQVQAQMFLMESNYCDFVLWTPSYFAIERIYPDQILWDDAVQKATQFFEKCILPEMLGKHFTSPTLVTLIDKESNESTEGWCYCGGEDEGEMICCDDDHCKIQWYHFECLGITTAPSGSWYCPQCEKCLNPANTARSE